MNEEKIFLEKIKIFSEFHMPRYSELPEIELYMDQVISVTDKYLGALSAEGDSMLTPSMINNYVKNRVIPPPEKKKYGRDHLAKRLVICLLKPTMEISAIADIIEKSEKLYGTPQMLDNFAQMYEARLSELARETSSAAKKGEPNENFFIAVAMENALRAGAEKTVAHFAYAAVHKEENAEKPEKAEKKKSKDKAKIQE
jgi:hypothetical protein